MCSALWILVLFTLLVNRSVDSAYIYLPALRSTQEAELEADGHLIMANYRRIPDWCKVELYRLYLMMKQEGLGDVYVAEAGEGARPEDLWPAWYAALPAKPAQPAKPARTYKALQWRFPLMLRDMGLRSMSMQEMRLSQDGLSSHQQFHTRLRGSRLAIIFMDMPAYSANSPHKLLQPAVFRAQCSRRRGITEVALSPWEWDAADVTDESLRQYLEFKLITACQGG
eukprot:gene15838-21963_t